MQHVDILRCDPLQDAKILKMFECLMNRTWLELIKPVDEFRTTIVVDGRIAVEPVDVKNALGVLLLVESLRTPEIRNPAQSLYSRTRQAPHAFRALDRFYQLPHFLISPISPIFTFPYFHIPTFLKSLSPP